MKLDDETLPQLTIPGPTYDRTQTGVGIVHFGVGGFHRAHQAAYVDQLLNAGVADGWGICGVGVLPADRRMADVMAAQNGLYTLLLEPPDGTREARVIGSILDYRFAPEDPDGVIELLAAPSTRIVSLTITEGGYFIDASTGKFDLKHPAIVADGENPDSPKTVFGLILAGLKRRRAEGTPPFTIMSCDNIPHNGDVTREAVVETARLSDPALADWIVAHVSFPNAMVDRITPVTTDETRASILAETGIEDRWPVRADVGCASPLARGGDRLDGWRRCLCAAGGGDPGVGDVGRL